MARHLGRAGRSAGSTGPLAGSVSGSGLVSADTGIRPDPTAYAGSASPGWLRWRSSIAVRWASRAG